MNLNIKTISVSIMFAFSILAYGLGSAYGVEPAGFSTEPKTNDGKKWRLAYYQGGNYVDYQTILVAVVQGLMDTGWIVRSKFPDLPDPDDTKTLWSWMSSDLKSEYIQFIGDAYFDSNWDTELRKETRAGAIERFNNGNIDFVLAFGTWAGQDLATNEHSTPIEVCSSSDPVGSNIVKSLEDSGYDHVHAKIEPTRYQRQVELFHDIIEFNTLGVVYEDTVVGRTYSAVDKTQAVAGERGFEVIPCFAPFSGVDDKVAKDNVLKCHQILSDKVDAVYITTHRGVNIANLPDLLAPLLEAKIPTFSMSGSKEVQHGVLLSIAQAKYISVGRFHAESIAKVLNGATSRDISQYFESPNTIAINLATAQVIGYDPPVDILAVADEIYEEISNPD
jgi:ABC-type uncharacterized transport system substrate-binding protein